MKHILILGVLAAALAPVCLPAASFVGDFDQDDDIALFSFSLFAPADVTISALGFNGGVNDAGNTIPPGGFESELAVYQVDGSLLDFTFPAPTPDDISLSLFGLAAGRYFVALTQLGNFALGDLTDGFAEAGNGDYTGLFGCPAGQFCDPDGGQRTSAYALDIVGADTAAVVPEPGAGLLILSALALFAAGRQLSRGALSQRR